MNSKEQKHAKVLTAVAKIMSSQGIKAVNPSRISRATGVSRGWIYKYLGSDMNFLIEQTVRHFVTQFTDLKPAQLDLSREELLQKLEDGFLDLIEKARSHPEVLALYFYATCQPSPLTLPLRKALDQHLKREALQIRKIFGRTEDEARAAAAELAALRIGLAHSATNGDLATLGKSAGKLAAVRSFHSILRQHRAFHV
jgi:AcrR family transcriptional regulator